MSTRGTVCIVKNGQMISMYNHYDSYPEGLGDELLNILKEDVINGLKQNFKNVNVITNQQILDIVHQAAGGKEEFDKLDYLGRNTAYQTAYLSLKITDDTPCSLINSIVMGEKINIKVSENWPADSLMCEYGYVIDLDKDTFEAYVGFNKNKVVGERFEYLNDVSEKMRGEDGGTIYYPIRHAGTWPLSKLPSTEELVCIVNEKSEIVSKENKSIEYLGYPVILKKYVQEIGKNKEVEEIVVANPLEMKNILSKIVADSLEKGSKSGVVSVYAKNIEVLKVNPICIC